MPQQKIQANQIAPGVIGTVWRSGTTAPTSGTGNDGDLYFNTVSFGIYKKTSGSWALLVTIGASSGLTPLLNNVPGAQTTAEDVSKLITGVSVSGSGTLTTTLTVSFGGSLQVTTGGGSTITGNSTGNVQLVGTSAQINNALAGLTFIPTQDFNGGSTITIATSDGSGTATDTINVTITPVADIVTDNIVVAFNTVTVFNVITGTNGASADTFSNSGRQLTSVTQPANASITFANNGTITFTPDTGFSGTTSFTYTVTSSGLPETGTVNVTVNPSSGSSVPGDIVDAGGTIVPSAYDAVFQAFADTTGPAISYRFGSPASATGVSTLAQRADLGRIRYGGNGTAPPDIYFQYGAEDQTGFNDFVTNNGALICAFAPSGATRPTTAFSQLQTMLDVYQIDRKTISQRPQLPWQDAVIQPQQISTYIAMGTTLGLDPNDPADRPIIEHRHPGGADHDNCRMGFAATQGSSTRPSRIYTLGTVTAQIPGMCILPLGYIPTSMCLTNGGELLMVTCVHRTNRTGHVLGFALGGTPAGVNWTDNPANFYPWWHELPDMVHPLFKNRGGWSFIKYLGKIDLPSNCSAPTACHMQNGFDPTEVIYYGTNNSNIGGLGDVATPLSANRTRFLPGGDLYRYVTKGAVCTVISQSEKTSVYIDVSSLFTYVNDMYFGSVAKNLETQYYYYNGTGAPASNLASVGLNYLNNANGDVYQKTNTTTWAIIGNIGTKRGVGMGANNWPYLWADVAGITPTVVKTVVHTSRLRGILGTYSYGYDSRNDTRREPGTPGYPMADPHYPQIWIMADGTDGHGEIIVMKAETYTPGRAPPVSGRVPTDIAQTGSIKLSGLSDQITCVAPVKDFDMSLEGVVYDPADAPPGSLDKAISFNDRKNRFIRIVQLLGNTGTTGLIAATMADSRMDCTSFAFVDGYYQTNKVVTMTNYTGQRIDNYRIASLTVLSYPKPAQGTPISYPTLSGTAGPPSVGGEFCGSFDLNGFPITIHCSNAP
jgi:hypothetical protein